MQAAVCTSSRVLNLKLVACAQVEILIIFCQLRDLKYPDGDDCVSAAPEPFPVQLHWRESVTHRPSEGFTCAVRVFEH